MAVSKKKASDAPAAAASEDVKNVANQAVPSTTSVKTEEKATVKKETEKKEPVKKEAAKKETAKKETTVKAAAKKETAKKAPVKRAAAKKETVKSAPVKRGRTAKADLKTDVHIQFNGKSYSQDDLIKIAKDVWKFDLKQKANALQSVELYVKPEENIVYYVMNKDFTGNFMI